MPKSWMWKRGYYYGARYYNPRISLWYGVDPLAEKYPAHSPYCYTMNNPIMLVDPDGRKVFLVNGYDGTSKKRKDASNPDDLKKMQNYWNGTNPNFTSDVSARFNDKDVSYVDGSQGGISHGSVKYRRTEGYKMASTLMENGTVDLSEPINIVSHSMGCAFGAGMADAFLEKNPEAVINMLLLAPDGAEELTIDSRINSAQYTYKDDGVVTDNKALVGNLDVNLNPKRIEYQPFLSKSISKAMKAHSAPIDNSSSSRSILNNEKLKSLFKIKPNEVQE